MVKRVQQKERGVKRRERKKLILIGAEGRNKTETAYFKNFNRIQNEYVIHFAGGDATDPMGIVNNTYSSVKSENLNLKDGDLAYCFIDFDVNKKNQESYINHALEKAKSKGIHMLISNPTFEIWYLLHFRYSTKMYNSNPEVIQELQKYIPHYEKNSNIYDLISTKTNEAINNAKKLEEYHKKSGNGDSMTRKCPLSETYKLVELLLK